MAFVWFAMLCLIVSIAISELFDRIGGINVLVVE